MFTERNRNEITKDDYFNVFKLNGDFYTLQSNNTKQYWIIKDSGEDVIHFHKHYSNQRYHLQHVFHDYNYAVKSIKKHDTYVLSRGLLKADRYEVKRIQKKAVKGAHEGQITKCKYISTKKYRSDDPRIKSSDRPFFMPFFCRFAPRLPAHLILCQRAF